MIRMQLQIELNDELDSFDADFAFKVHAATHACQRVSGTGVFRPMAPAATCWCSVNSGWRPQGKKPRTGNEVLRRSQLCAA